MKRPFSPTTFSFLLLAALVWPGRSAAQPARPPQQHIPAILRAKPEKPASGDSEMRALLKARYNSALRILQHQAERVLRGTTLVDMVVVESARRVLQSKLALIPNPVDQAPIYQQYLDLMREFEKIYQARWDKQTLAAVDLEFAKYLRLDAEVQYLQARERVKSSQAQADKEGKTGGAKTGGKPGG